MVRPSTLAAEPRTSQTPSPRGFRLRWWTSLAATVLWVTACGGDGPTGPGGAPPPPTPVGSYVLSTIDAKALPWMRFNEVGYTLEVQSGKLNVTADGKWAATTVSKETVAGNVSTYTDSTFGTWQVATGAKTAVFINTETGTTSNATWTATDATIVQLEGATTRTIVYRKN